VALTQAEVRKLGLTARLDLSDDDIEKLQVDLNAILTYVEQMEELNLDGVEPTTHSNAEADALREDIMVPSMPREAVLANAPQQKDGAFLIPRIKAPGQEDSGGSGFMDGGSA